MLEKFFHLKENNTTVRTELIAGITTFMTMSYIIFVNPSILAETGMDFGAVMVATIVASSTAMLLMGLWVNYPIALAPGMGLNAYFTYSVCLGMGYPWQTALGAVFISGVLFLVLTFLKIRQLVVDSIPNSIKLATAAGIGLFIAFIGLQNAALVKGNPQTLVTLGQFTQPSALLTLFGVMVIAALMQLKVRGAILYGILLNWFIGLVFGLIEYQGIFSLPPNPAPTFLKLSLSGIWSEGLLTIIFAFFFVDLFDSTGTLVGVAEQGGFIKSDGSFPRVERALTTDAAGTIVGSLMGTSTVTAYIESASGIAEGGRTGLTTVFVAILFLFSLFLSPLAKSIPTFATAPALIVVGSLMMKQLTKLPWDDVSEMIPAFAVMLFMPLTYSIANGIAMGFIFYPIVKALSGKFRDIHWLTWILCFLFLFRFFFLEI
jgi:AGZA family xanthine/uracil permease-like MFS transporter